MNYNCVPEKRQLIWQEMEFYGFVHFGMNTMTNREWGEGNEDLTQFHPEELDCRQWIKALKKSGMTGAILTCKHHDGFCLWPSKYTTHTIEYTPYQNGKGDIVKEFSEACKKEGLKFGIYLSPWDLTEKSYGKGKEYDDFYVNQLRELLTEYGDIFEVWFDGANGNSDSDRRQYYDWDRYYQVIRELQPNAVIAVCGPDVRWVGNEAGQARKNEWSVVPVELQDVEKTIESSQQVDDDTFSRKLASSDEDLGSRQALKNYSGELVWYPAEVNTSIRKGWFYHSADDVTIRNSDELFDLYLKAVGGNSTFLLNVPPMKNGLLNQKDVEILGELGRKVSKLKTTSVIQADRKIPLNSNLVEGIWQGQKEERENSLHILFEKARVFNGICLKENIEKGQRIEKLAIFYLENQTFKYLTTIESIGYQRIAQFPSIKTKEIKLVCQECRDFFYLKSAELLQL